MLQIVKNMRTMDGRAAFIGIQGPEAGALDPDHGEFTNVELGVVHEFGAPGAGIPERSFLRSTFDAKIRDWTDQAVKVAKRVYSSTPQQPGRVLALMAEKAKSDVQNAITQGIEPPIQEATIEARRRQFGKASSTPLLASGQLQRAITWRIK
jgi:hypothetical protein